SRLARNFYTITDTWPKAPGHRGTDPLSTCMSQDLLSPHLPHIHRVVSHLCRRYYFQTDECQDFRSEVYERLIEDDYAVFRKFQGRASLNTYLTTVISNMLKDYLNRLLGKWRASAEAERMGPIAVLLEQLLVRDGHTFDEAVQILHINRKMEISWRELDRIRARLPHRTRRQMEGEKGLHGLVDPNEGAEAQALEEERAAARQKALEALEEARKLLPDEDQLILMMQGNGFKVADISRTLRLDQKPLYRRIQRIHKDLRDELGRRGIHGLEPEADPDEDSDEDPEE
ncbi:MAG: sigma-70 family RNA polymerase sigma factor, partial [Myxococcales bacterium]